MSGWPDGYGRRVMAEVDSTNAEAARVAPGLTRPEWILGLRQTQGRGRRGRAWSDPEGNFAATLVLQPTESPEVVALRSFVAALALFDAVSMVTGRSEGLALKWPNDVLLNGGKLAGILLESLGTRGGVAHLAIGVGVNLGEAPEVDSLHEGALRPVALAEETGALVTPEEFLELLAARYAEREAAFVAEGFGTIREAWLMRAARLGEQIVARTGREEWRGTFETVDARGNLVITSDGERRAIPAAEVFF